MLLVHSMIVGRLIKAYRKEEKLSIRTLAKTIGVNHSTLWRLERGEEIQEKQWVKMMVWILTGQPADSSK